MLWYTIIPYPKPHDTKKIASIAVPSHASSPCSSAPRYAAPTLTPREPFQPVPPPGIPVYRQGSPALHHADCPRKRASQEQHRSHRRGRRCYGCGGRHGSRSSRGGEGSGGSEPVVEAWGYCAVLWPCCCRRCEIVAVWCCLLMPLPNCRGVGMRCVSSSTRFFLHGVGCRSLFFSGRLVGLIPPWVMLGVIGAGV